MGRRRGGRATPLPPFDICRIRTDRLRMMSNESLKRAWTRIGRLFEIPKKEQGDHKPRWLVSAFMTDIVQCREYPEAEDAAANAIYRRNYGVDPTPNSKIKKMYCELVEEREQKIWDMQVKKKCSIRSTELVARDAWREGKRSFAERIRGKKRRAKIR